MVSEWGAVYKLIKEMKSQGGNVYRYILPKGFSSALLAKTIIKEFQDPKQNLTRKRIFRPNRSNFISDGKCQVAFFSQILL